MPNKPAFTIAEQIQLLKSRGMLFRDESQAAELLKNISYYRLKGYWWDMQIDYSLHTFKPSTYFEDIVARYDFDRNLRLILFDAIERIEIKTGLGRKNIDRAFDNYRSFRCDNSSLNNSCF